MRHISTLPYLTKYVHPLGIRFSKWDQQSLLINISLKKGGLHNIIHSLQNHVKKMGFFSWSSLTRYIYNTLQNPSITELSILMIYRICMLQTHSL